MLVTGDYREALGSIGVGLSERARFLAKILDGKIVALAAFDNYDGTNIEIHIASTQWTRDWIRACFRFCFDICNCRRVTALVDTRNDAMKGYMDRLGFKHEGVIRHGLPDSDIEIFGMLREECKWVAKAHRK